MMQRKGSNTDGDPSREDFLWEPFPTDALPEPLAEFVQRLSSDLGTDPVLVAYPLLAVLGRSIGLRRAVRISSTWIEYPIVWAATTGRGSGENPAIEAVLTPLNDLDEEFCRERRRLEDAYRAALKDYERERRKAVKAGLTPPPRPTPPKIRRLYTRLATREAVVDDMVLSGDMALLVVEDLLSELVVWIRRKQETGNGEVNFWMNLWSGESFTLVRRSGHIYIPRAAACVCGHIRTAHLLQWLQEDIVSGMTERGIPIGLAARFLFAMPPTPKKQAGKCLHGRRVDCHRVRQSNSPAHRAAGLEDMRQSLRRERKGGHGRGRSAASRPNKTSAVFLPRRAPDRMCASGARGAGAEGDWSR